MGHDAARHGSVLRSAERCRAAPPPNQNKSLNTNLLAVKTNKFPGCRLTVSRVWRKSNDEIKYRRSIDHW